MANGDQVDRTLQQIKLVHHTIVAYAQSKFRQSFQPMVRELIQTRTNFCDFLFNLLPNATIQLEKDAIKLTRVDFLMAHDAIQD